MSATEITQIITVAAGGVTVVCLYASIYFMRSARRETRERVLPVAAPRAARRSSEEDAPGVTGRSILPAQGLGDSKGDHS